MTVCGTGEPLLMRAACLVALLAVAELSSAEDCVKEAPQTIDGKTAEFESCAAAIDEVFTANSEGYRFIAYATKWKGQRIIVSDLNGESHFSRGDHIFFTVMKLPSLDKPETAQKRIMFIFNGGYAPSAREKP